MGCSVSRRIRHANIPPAADAGDDSESDSCDIDPEDADLYVTLDEAVVYVSDELSISVDRAQDLIDMVQQNKRGNVSSLDLVMLNARIKDIKDYLQPKFESYDPDHTGFVEPIDAIAILTEEFDGLPYSHIQSMVQRYDKDNDNRVDFGEFILSYSCVKAKKESLERRFQSLDVDHSGDLGVDELVEVLMTECALKEVQARALIEHFDLDSNGTIDRQEFNHMWSMLFG